ncbi:MAG: DUF2442 domain-containing protein [Acidobacteria bacterium]|nr:DUF2442 domain-containing protein [Acidobacteriota bacterium]MBK8147257.1 DUF2442 domain-containing protein [Acidobacteriota bacterium]MBK8810420.1 DUF2442 domain-containing protein [Acidobacteriota bacterium]
MDKKNGNWTLSDDAVSKSLELATKRGRKFLDSAARASSAVFDPEQNLIVIKLTNGCVFGFPPHFIRELESASTDEIAKVSITPQGTAIHWEDLDAHYRLVGLLNGIFGTKTWMAELGRKGGCVSSDSKAKAARLNGAKGGRPRKDETHEKAARKRKLVA